MTLDAVTGLYYERNRNYSPSLGTWISQDPLQYVNGANTYQFVMSGSVEHVDTAGTTYWKSAGPFGPVMHNGVPSLMFIRELRPSCYNFWDELIGAKILKTKQMFYSINGFQFPPSGENNELWEMGYQRALKDWLTNENGIDKVESIISLEKSRVGLLEIRPFVITQWLGGALGAAGGASSEGADSVNNAIGTGVSSPHL